MKKRVEDPDSLSRTERINNRILERVNSAGEKTSICEKCGQPFEQVLRNATGTYTKFKQCERCRSAGKGTRVVIPYTPHPGQALFHDSPARFRVLAAGARWGKDRCCVMEFIRRFTEMLSEERGPEIIPTVHGWVIAPTYRLSRQIWLEFKHFFPTDWIEHCWESDQMIETVNGGLVEVRSADDPKALVGVGLDIVWITETARINNLDEVWANLELRLLSPGRGPHGSGGLALINSTPLGRGFFYKMFTWGQKDNPNYDPDWESWKHPSWDNPYLSSKDKAYLKRMRSRFPDRIYRQEVEAEFLAESNSVYPTAEECATYTGSNDPVPNEEYVIGWDPARAADYSGVAIRNSQGETVYITRWTGKPWTNQLDEIYLLSAKYNYAPVVVDSTGIGDTLIEGLSQRGILVDAVYFNSGSKEKLVNNLALLIEQQAISYPNWDALVNELKDYGYTITPNGNVKYSATGDKHDDLVTSLMLVYKDYNLPGIVIPWMGVIGALPKSNEYICAI